MKAISLYQPWASLMAVGAKRNETRSWPTAYRGDLAICASKHWDDDCEDFLYNELTQALLQPVHGELREGMHVSKRELPFGAVLCVVTIFDSFCTGQSELLIRDRLAENGVISTEEHCGNYGFGRHIWKTRNLRRLAYPVPVVGHQGLFNLPADVEKAVRKQL